MSSQMFKRLVPTLNRVLVKRMEPELKTKSGIILQQAQDKSVIGEVVAVGPGLYDNNGNLQKVLVQVGQTVLLPEYGGQEVKLDGQDFFIYRDSDITGILS